MTLEKSDDGIDQVSKEDRENKDDNDSPRNVDNGEPERENQDGQQDSCCPAIKYRHKPPSAPTSSATSTRLVFQFDLDGSQGLFE
jgi:hypothetical protein